MEDGMRRITSPGANASAEVMGVTEHRTPGLRGLPEHRATVRKSLEDAVGSLGIEAPVMYVDQEALPRGDPRRGWPAPTILVDGRDLFRMAAPEGAEMSCRMYPGGAPGASEIAAALRAR
jgi:hypothetical protein